MFITLEGLDFSGKSTALATIQDALPEGTVLTREPGGTRKGEAIREILTQKSQELTGEQKLELFFESRLDHVEKRIDPAIQAGQLVISDRYVGSTYAYQIAGDGLPFELVDQKTKTLFAAYPTAQPDLTIYFKVSPDVRLQRMSLRDQDALDKYDKAFYARVEAAYLKGIHASSKALIELNADESQDIVAQQLLNTIQSFIKAG